MLDRVDHIVFCAPTLESGIDYILERTGIQATYGGRHLSRGTHNAIFKLGNHSYFEILAPDPENKNIPPPRWMGVDLIENPRITRWAIKSDTIVKDAKILSNYKPMYGHVQSGSRALKDGALLSWQLTDPLSEPAVEVVPFLLDWQESTHPSATLPDVCKFIGVKLEHPDHSAIRKAVNPLDIDVLINPADKQRIIVTLDTSKGVVEIY